MEERRPPNGTGDDDVGLVDVPDGPSPRCGEEINDNVVTLHSGTSCSVAMFVAGFDFEDIYGIRCQLPLTFGSSYIICMHCL